MLTAIARFEVRNHLRSPLFFIGFALFFLLTFGSVAVDDVQIGSRGNVNVNSPYAILETLSILDVFALFIATAFVANAVIRDQETGFAPILYSTRVRKRDYLLGRFIGAMVVALLLICSVPLAIMLGSLMPWLDPHKIGPFVLGHYLYALFLFGLPTLLVIGAGFFALATVTRSMMWTYVGAVGFLVLYFASMTLLRDPSYDHLTALIDPFGNATLDLITKYWTAAERNSQLPLLQGVLLENRLLWLGIAAGLFVLAYALFRFEDRGVRRPRRDAAGAAAHGATVSGAAEVESAGPGATVVGAGSWHTRSPGGPGWEAFLALTRFDMRSVFSSPAFFVLLAIGVLNAYGGLLGTVTRDEINYFPVTRAVIEGLRGAYAFIPLIIAIYYSGELVWRDRERHIHEIVDACPAPDWAFLLPKVVAVGLVLFATVLVGVLTGIAFQLGHLYSHVELTHYLLWFVLPHTITAWQLAVLTVFVQSLVPHKALGWAVMMIYLVLRVTLGNIGYEHGLYHYGFTTNVPLSDMNGLGRFWIGRAWFEVYWSCFAVILVVIAQLLWRRGNETRLRPRLAGGYRRLRGPAAVVLGAAAAVCVGTGAYIYYNTNVLNDYVISTARGEERYLADYEKLLLAYESVPQPRIIAVKLDVQLYPQRVRADTVGSYVIENRTGQPLSQLHVRWNKPLELLSIDVGAATLEKDYKEFDYRIYHLSSPMAPGERRSLRFTTRLQERGFPNARPLTRIVDNGTFINNIEISPQLGMSRDFLLKDRTKRRRYGLSVDLRPPKLEDAGADVHNYIRHDSDWVNAEISVTTDADQTPLAPGYTVSDQVKDGRRTLVTRTEAPILHFFSIQSARYAINRDVWTGKQGQKVDLAVYYFPGHDHNIARIVTAMKASLDLFGERFSPYQFRQVRILEFPAYDTFAQSFANTIPFSEGIGFIQDFDDSHPERNIDLVTFVTAHELGHQWWAHQVIGADKQGDTMLSETFSQYSALLVMEKLYGREHIRKFLKNELDRYLRSRGTEVVEELPLERVEDQPYIHYRKGAVAMYWLKEVVGEEPVDRALQKLLARYAFKPAPYPSTTEFLALLRAEAGPAHDRDIADLFEKITLYDMKARDGVAHRRADGRYDITFTVEGRKLYADGLGKELEVPLDESFDVGAFTVEPGKTGYSSAAVLSLQRLPVRSGSQSLTLTVDKLPRLVGIDPFNERIDRNSEDNLTEVRLAR
jgi:aminopeptidase N/ABC-type transport system involved in multi-copper enzyme maturation permease subunit